MRKLIYTASSVLLFLVFSCGLVFARDYKITDEDITNLKALSILSNRFTSQLEISEYLEKLKLKSRDEDWKILTPEQKIELLDDKIELLQDKLTRLEAGKK